MKSFQSIACVEALTIFPPFYASLMFCTLLSAGLRYYKSLWSLHWHLDKGLAPCKIWCCDPVMSKCIYEDGKCKKSWASSGLMMKWKILFFNTVLFSEKCFALLKQFMFMLELLFHWVCQHAHDWEKYCRQVHFLVLWTSL